MVAGLESYILDSAGPLGCILLVSGSGEAERAYRYWVELFAKIGIGQWFRYFTGGLEVICAALLLIPKTAAIAAALLACAMTGAVLIHLFVLRDGYASLFPGFPLVILIAIAWKRRSVFPMKEN